MPGPLILAGGAEFDERMAAADRAFLEATGRTKPRLAVLPTANDGRPALAAANGVAHFRSLGVDAEAVMVTTRESANDERLVAALSEVDAIYFAGGNPRYLYSVLEGSQAWQTIQQRWREGMALGGSSAGAMVLCAAIYVQGSWGGALGLVADAVALPHFDRRDAASVRQAQQAVSARGHLGLGIDESTALVWSADVWQVAGRGRVQVLAADGVEVYASAASVPIAPPG